LGVIEQLECAARPAIRGEQVVGVAALRAATHDFEPGLGTCCAPPRGADVAEQDA
jgi:hypothetical protein